MITYVENDNISKKIFDKLPINEKYYISSSGEYDYNPDYMFSLIYHIKKKNIGFIDAYLDSYYKQPYISIAVLPKYRNFGIATKLLKEMENEIRIRGYLFLIYTFSSENISSMKFAEKNEFKFENKLDDFIITKKYIV